MQFDEIYDAHFKDVYLYILRLSGSDQIAEEITSDAFFKAMRSIESFRGECDLRVWLCQIAKNCYYSFLKKNKRITSVEDVQLQEAVDPNAFVDEVVVNSEEAKQIQKLLHTIQDPYKEVFMWRVFAELSYKQIGQIFNKSENWACVTYHRAKTMLQNRLEENNREK